MFIMSPFEKQFVGELEALMQLDPGRAEDGFVLFGWEILF